MLLRCESLEPPMSQSGQRPSSGDVQNRSAHTPTAAKKEAASAASAFDGHHIFRALANTVANVVVRLPSKVGKSAQMHRARGGAPKGWTSHCAGPPRRACPR